MLDVYWLEQTEADVPAENDWLSANEILCLNSMRFPKRRTDWRLGRWTAKRALALCLNKSTHPEAFARIEIRSAVSGAPEAFFPGNSAGVTLSLSHRAGSAVCAVALRSAALGCDLEMIEPRSQCFVADYFTPEEQAFVARAAAADRFFRVALVWSGKESALKALHEGLRLDARCMQVIVLDAAQEERARGWRPLQVRYAHGAVFSGWWKQAGNSLRTLVAIPAPTQPILLNGLADGKDMREQSDLSDLVIRAC